MNALEFVASIQEGIARGHAIVARLTALCDRLEEINGVKARRIRNLKAAMASEPDLFKPWPKRTRKRVVLDTGEIAEPAPGRTIATKYLRGPYTEGDVDMLRKIVAAQPMTFTYEETMRLRSRRNVDQAEIMRVRKGI